MVNIPKKWNVYTPRPKTHPQPRRAHLRVIRRDDRFYVEMRWGHNASRSRLLGRFPSASPTPFMDVALYAAHAPGRLELDELYRLLHADKSFQIT